MLAAKPIDRIFHALGDPTRRSMVERLSQGPLSVSRLAEPLAITLAAVVQHLQILEESGLVRTEKVDIGDLNLTPPRSAATSASLDEMSLEAVESILIRKALARAQGNVSQAAEALGLSRGALYRRMEKYAI